MNWRNQTRFVAPLVLAVAMGTASIAQQKLADEWLGKPVDDRTFKTYLDFFTYDRRLPFEIKTIGTDEQEGIKREHLSFQSTPGVQVFGHLYQPPGTGAARPATIIALHGGGAGGKRGLSRLAVNLSRAGWTVFAIDLQYFGERSSDLLTTFTEQEKHDRLYNQPPVYLAWVAQAVKDVGRSIDFLAEHRGADSRRVGILGASRGAMLTPIVAAIDRRLAAGVMLYAGHFDALERTHLPAACPANYIGRVSPRPLLMLNGLYDTDMIKETSVEPLYRLANQPKQILWSDGGHAAPSEHNQALMLQWLREHLK